MLIREMILPEFDTEMANTRKLLAIVPEDFDFKPHDKSMALGRLASHVAEMPGWAKMTLETEVLNFDQGTWEPWIAKSREELLAKFEAGVTEARAVLEKATDEDLTKTWKMIWQGQEFMKAPRYRVLQDSVLNHLVHHRAQLGVYLRLKNIEIPGAYGPSADDMAKMAPAAGATA